MSDMNFGEPSGGGFIDTHFDFSRCQRPDGSFYGTSGQCRKGSPAGPKEKDAVAPAPKKTTKKDPVANVLKQQAETAALKKDMDKDVTALAKAGKIKGVSKADVERIQARKAAAAKEKRDSSKDLKNRRGTVIGTSPRNMLIDNRTMFQKRLKDARSDQERKLLQDAIDKINKRLETE